MTRKDFPLIATTLRGCYVDGYKTIHDMYIKEFIKSLAKTNSKFDVQRFERACKL